MNYKVIILSLTLVSLCVIRIQRAQESSFSPTEKRSTKITVSDESKMGVLPFSHSNELTDKHIRLLEETLASPQADNDPRLDSEFDGLSRKTILLLRKKYQTLSPSRFNERGTIIYLLGKNISERGDIDFFRHVIEELPPSILTPINQGDEHGIGVTLVYPQLVALRQLAEYTRAGESNASLVRLSKRILIKAKRSRNPEIARMAEGLSSPR